jgi:hypothetical protein
MGTNYLHRMSSILKNNVFNLVVWVVQTNVGQVPNLVG